MKDNSDAYLMKLRVQRKPADPMVIIGVVMVCLLAVIAIPKAIWYSLVWVWRNARRCFKIGWQIVVHVLAAWGVFTLMAYLMYGG